MLVRDAGTLLLALCAGTSTSCAEGDAAQGGVPAPALDDSGVPLDPYSDEGQAYCMAKQDAYYAFLAAHRACTTDSDCAVVGDCGPNADFSAVATSAAHEAYELAKARCPGTFDGPVFDARCIAQRCELEQRTDTCCGCPPGVGP